MYENTVFINNKKNYKYNFNKRLLNTSSIEINNCKNIDITIRSKINKIIIINSSKVNLIIGDMITGIEIFKGNCININIIKNKNINSLELFKSTVKINKLNFKLIDENSNIKLKF
jgi:hypothetical protein